MRQKIILAGGSGLVGRHLMQLLADTDDDLHVIGRRPFVGITDGANEHVADAALWPEAVGEVKADIAISCLGTTWKKSGQDEAAFRAVDLDLVLAFAGAARKAGATHMIVVSSVGASSHSSNFYLHTKGEMEDALRQLNFDRLDILRPGLLTGERGSDRRAGERLAIAFSPLTNALLHGPLRRYRSIKAATVAQAIAALAVGGGVGKHIHESDAIEALAG